MLSRASIKEVLSFHTISFFKIKISMLNVFKASQQWKLIRLPDSFQYTRFCFFIYRICLFNCFHTHLSISALKFALRKLRPGTKSSCCKWLASSCLLPVREWIGAMVSPRHTDKCHPALQLSIAFTRWDHNMLTDSCDFLCLGNVPASVKLICGTIEANIKWRGIAWEYSTTVVWDSN